MKQKDSHAKERQWGREVGWVEGFFLDLSLRGDLGDIGLEEN